MRVCYPGPKKTIRQERRPIQTGIRVILRTPRATMPESPGQDQAKNIGPLLSESEDFFGSHREFWEIRAGYIETKLLNSGNQSIG